LCGLCLLLVVLSEVADADDADFDYDIFRFNDTLTVWLDITPVLTQSKMEDLLAGLNISILIEVEIKRPRKLVLSKTLASGKAAVLISRRLTQDIYQLRIARDTVAERTFKDQLALSDYLADSLVIPVAALAGIGGGDVYLDISLKSKSYSNNTLDDIRPRQKGAAERNRGDDTEFFESLFSTFLDLIGFGTSSYHITTPIFSPGDLPSF
jgi:hypothetical protein